MTGCKYTAFHGSHAVYGPTLVKSVECIGPLIGDSESSPEVSINSPEYDCLVVWGETVMCKSTAPCYVSVSGNVFVYVSPDWA